MLNKITLAILILPYSLYGCSDCLWKLRDLVDQYSLKIIQIEMCSDYKEFELCYLMGKLEAYNESMMIVEDCTRCKK